jgi:SAM-dependent methyltransferase
MLNRTEQNRTEQQFPRRLRLYDPNRHSLLIQEYYEQHHDNRCLSLSKDDEKKVSFFKEFLMSHPPKIGSIGIDLGCRGGIITKQLKNYLFWVGVDIDRDAIQLANDNGIPCIEMNFSIAIDIVDKAFDIVMMTDVLEHLPYPPITVKEIHRILKKGSDSGYFFGSVPLDYHLHRRFSVMRGRRLEGDPTHIHSFSFNELDKLLRHYFECVEYRPLRGTAARHPNWRLPYQHFVRDIAWVAWQPRIEPIPWKVCLIH